MKRRKKKTVYGYFHNQTCYGFTLKESENILNFIKEIHPDTFHHSGHINPNNTFIKITDKGWDKENTFYSIKTLYKMTPYSFREKILKYISLDDAMMSFNSYISPSSKKDQLFYITMLVVDIDYHNMFFEDPFTGDKTRFADGTDEEWQYNRVMYFLENDHFGKDIPEPTYIEKGRNIRLYYVFQEPIFIAKNNKFRRFIQQVQDKFADRVDYLGGDHQQINSYIRLSGSFNVKMGTNHAYKVALNQYKDGQKYTWEDICEYIPDKPDWKKTRTQMAHTKKKNYCMNFESHNYGVIRDIEAAQKYYNSKEIMGHREKFAHLYLNFLLLNNMDFEKALDKTLEFNNNWVNPIPERKLKSALNNMRTKTYCYSNKTLRDIIGDGPEVSTICIKGKMTKEEKSEYNHEYYEKNTAKKYGKRKKLTEKILNIVEELKKIGLSNKDIVKKLKKKKIELSVKTIEKYVTKLIKAGRYIAKRNNILSVTA